MFIIVNVFTYVYLNKYFIWEFLILIIRPRIYLDISKM